MGAVEAHARLGILPQYEYASVPGDDPPILGVLVDIEAHGNPIVARKGPVAHVILALDISASMDRPDKYPVLESALGSMLDDLQKRDAADVLLSVVIFSRGAETLIKGVSAKDVDKGEFRDALRRRELHFRDYTDIPGALSLAGRIAYDQWKANRRLPVRIYLLTDGKPQDVESSRAKAERLARIPADIHGLAFGADANVAVLQDLIAGKRGGTVKSVRRETIASAFERVAEVAQKVVATRCQVEIGLEPGVVGGEAFRYRPARVRFPDPAFQDRKFSADLGTIETGRTYSLLFEVRPPETSEENTVLGEATVRIPSFGGPIAETVGLAIERTGPGSELGEVDRAVRNARDILRVLTDDEPETALRALRLRRTLYLKERRDPGLLSLLDRAILLLETTGGLTGLAPDEHATLIAHTCTSPTAWEDEPD